MNYFIETVNTYSTTGKSKKGAAIQTAVKTLEHCLLKDEDALASLTLQLKNLVDVCNDKYKGNPIKLHITTGQFSIRPPETGNETPIATIQYAPVLAQLAADEIRSEIATALFEDYRDIASEYIKAARKGGKA